MSHELRRRIHNLINLDGSLDQCPNCHSICVQKFLRDVKEKAWRLFPTMICSDCKYEWMPNKQR